VPIHHFAQGEQESTMIDTPANRANGPDASGHTHPRDREPRITASDERAISDPAARLAQASTLAPLSIELGSRGNKRDPHSVGIDRLPGEGVDVCGEAIAVLKGLPSETVSSIYSEHFVEHLDDLGALLQEAARVLVDDGQFHAVAPHFSNPYFYSDPTHRHFFGLYTFCYYSQADLFRRKTPDYGFDAHLQLTKVTLGFRASRPFYVRHLIRSAFGHLINRNPALQEFYEDVLSGVIGCYEIEYQLRRRPRQEDPRNIVVAGDQSEPERSP
jgi:Methyltransferase domain